MIILDKLDYVRTGDSESWFILERKNGTAGTLETIELLHVEKKDSENGGNISPCRSWTGYDALENAFDFCGLNY